VKSTRPMARSDQTSDALPEQSSLRGGAVFIRRTEPRVASWLILTAGVRVISGQRLWHDVHLPGRGCFLNMPTCWRSGVAEVPVFRSLSLSLAHSLSWLCQRRRGWVRPADGTCRCRMTFQGRVRPLPLWVVVMRKDARSFHS
jgi:hypothetical protein